MKNQNNNCWIVGVGMEDRSYSVNGVTYVVSSRFTPTSTKETHKPTLAEKLHIPVRTLHNEAKSCLSLCFVHGYSFNEKAEKGIIILRKEEC